MILGRKGKVKIVKIVKSCPLFSKVLIEKRKKQVCQKVGRI
jgi:hypothetical protein